MAEIAISVIAKLAEYLVAPLLRQGRYLCCAGNIKKTLENEKQELASKRDGVQKRVREALNRTEEIDDAVDKWLAEVGRHMEEVEKLVQEMNGRSSCFQGRCPTWTRYRLCRQMTEIIEATEKLIKSSDFNPFSTLAPLSTVGYPSSRHFEYFESTKKASDQLLAALRDNDTLMIGLYGMGGSGKTTLVTEVGKQAEELNLFDHVIIVTVSQTPNIRKIQGEIADMLGLGLKEESEVGRAARLSKRLSNGERILIILDDVWAMISLKDVGIPFEDYHHGCKMLLTTRRQQVCNMMGCERKIPLHLLSDEESLTLLRKHAHTIDEPFSSVAQGIVKECKGLPIAIQAVGASLKGKSIEEWKEALETLRASKPIDVEPGVRDAFACLHLSYDYLRSKEAKSLFLMCSMYPEDADISVEDLFRITIGLGMYEDLSSIENVRNKVMVCVNNLVDSSLLMRSEKKKDHLRMHDTIRDVALWISSTQENRPIRVNLEKDLKVATNDESIKDCYALTYWCHEASQFPRALDAPKLEILLLTNIDTRELSEADFGGMGALKIMQIKSRFYGTTLSLLPCSMNLLANLRTLRLQGWGLVGDLSWLLGLKRLEVLDLKGSSFQDLPQGLEKLSNLKLLDLPEIKEKSFRIIERCTQLQELYASEIKLSTIEYSTPGKCFPNDVIFPRLRRYKCEIGRLYYALSRVEVDSLDISTKSLTLRGLKISTSGPLIKDLLQQANNVCLHELEGGCKNIVPEIVHVVGGMNELAILHLDSCSDLECVADTTSHHINLFQVEPLIFPKLIKLKLQYLTNLKEIWRGPPLLCFFKKLQELYISNCSMLTSLFPKCVAKAQLLLQKLTIEDCSKLKNIIEEDADDGVNNEITSASENAHLVFSKLKSLTITKCAKLEYVFSNSCVQGLEQLEEVRIDMASQLKYAFGQNPEIQINHPLPNLRSLQIYRCNNLECLFSVALDWNHLPNIVICPNLTLLILEQVPSLKEFFLGLSLSNTCLPLFFGSKLAEVRLESAPGELWLMIWRAPSHIGNLVYLRSLELCHCNKLKYVFGDEGIQRRSLPMLENLTISNCHELEEIMMTQDNQFQTCFPKVKYLKVEHCYKLKCIFSTYSSSLTTLLPQLYKIEISECAELEQLFRHNTSGGADIVKEIMLPNLAHICLTKLPSLVDICKGFKLMISAVNIETISV